MIIFIALADQNGKESNSNKRKNSQDDYEEPEQDDGGDVPTNDLYRKRQQRRIR